MKAGKGLYRGLLVEADFLLNAIYSITRILLRLGTDGRYSVTNGKVLMRVFCFFRRADILSLNLISKRVFSKRLFG